MNLEKYKKKYTHPQIKFTGSVFGDELLSFYINSSNILFFHPQKRHLGPL